MKQRNPRYTWYAVVFLISSPLRSNLLTDTYDKYIKKWITETAQYTYELEEQEDTLIISLQQGDISVKGWNGNAIVTTICKRAPYQETLNGVSLYKKKESNNSIALTTNQAQHTQLCTTDITVLVPKQMHVIASSENGSVKIKDIAGNATATTQQGKIKIKNVAGTVLSQTTQGNITVKKPQHNVRATTQYGTITIDESCKSVVASTQQGSIFVMCKHVPSQSYIQLASATGAITLGLPATINADLYARTEKGALTCEHFITTKPQTLQLNNKTWQQLKREVHGILGSGEAQIKLTSTNSSIKIVDTTLNKTVAI